MELSKSLVRSLGQLDLFVSSRSNELVELKISTLSTSNDFHGFLFSLKFDWNELSFFSLYSDVANPLIGDLIEYERFVYVHTDAQARVPADHGDKRAVSSSAVVRYQEESE